MKKAFSVVQIKGVDEEQRVVRGIATTPRVDRMGDIIEPLGVRVAADIPLFLYHDSKQTVGRAKFGKATKDGIPFEARLPKVSEAGRLQERVDEAWQMLKYGLITAVSIGFNAIGDAYERLTDGGFKFLETEVLELSLVPIPAQPDAVITGIRSGNAAAMDGLFRVIKSIDEQTLAALGRKGSPRTDRNRPGASGQRNEPPPGGFFHSRSRKGTNVKTLKDLLELRQTKDARLQELATAMKAADHEDDDEENAEFDSLTAEVKALDKDIRIARYESVNAASAKAAEGGSREEGSRSRSSNIIVRGSDKEETFKGQNFVRKLIAKAIAMHTHDSPSEIAQARWGKSNPTLVRIIKAGVQGGSTDTWGQELVNADANFTGDFIEFLYGMTVFDKLPLTRVPANVLIKGQDGAGTGYWVGESKGIPATALDFSSVELTPHKVAALCVVSNELLMDASPDAEQLIRNALAEASAQRIDTTFLSTSAAVSGVSPAGILNGVTALFSAGPDAADLRTDIAALYASFITAKNSRNLALVTNPSLAKAASLMVNALGQPEFAAVNGNGGNLLGDPVYVGDNVGAGDLILLSPRDIYRIGDTGVQISMSREAMIEQDTAPTGATDTPAAATANMVSMFQEESTAFKVVRRISFAKRRTSAVAYIGDAAYGAGT